MDDLQFLATIVNCRRGRWTIGQLRAAFSVVADKANWKHAICAAVPVGQVDLTLDAIEYHAGGRARVDFANHEIGRASCRERVCNGV